MADSQKRAARGMFRKRKYEVAAVLLGVMLPLVLIEAIMTSSFSHFVGGSKSAPATGKLVHYTL